jgi:CubicO group peptidase (beta-lactamase class C family)
MIARITGMSYEEYIHQTLIVPLGLNSTSFIAPHRSTGAVLNDDRTWGWNVGVNNP